MENRIIKMINPMEMTKDEGVLLFYTLTNNRQFGNFYDKDILLSIYPYRDIPEDFRKYSHIQLMHSIAKRPRTKNPSEDRYEIYGDLIGSGAYGKITHVMSTLTFADDFQIVLKNKNRVLKEMFAFSSFYESELKLVANQEYLMSKWDKELGSKPPVFSINKSDKYQARSIMVMKLIPGEDLAKKIDKDQIEKEIKNNIETDARIKWSISVARSFENLHRHNIIHIDIKTANVMIDTDSPFIKSKVIDFGGSKRIGEKTTIKEAYTPIYASPEVLKGIPATIESDVYSASWVFNLIWRGDDNHIKIEGKKLDEKILKAKKPISDEKKIKKIIKLEKKNNYQSKHLKFHNLFVGINDLDKSHKKQIGNSLKRMSSEKPYDRGEMSDITELFENISFERLVAKIPKNDIQMINDLKQAHLLGIQIRKELDKLITPEFTKITNEGLEQLNNIFKQNPGIKILADKQEVISLFIERLQVVAFFGLKSKQEILDKLVAINDHYNGNIQILKNINIQIVELRNKILESAHTFINTNIDFNAPKFILKLKNLSNDVTYTLNNLNDELSIDNIVTLNNKLIKKIDKFESIIEITKNDFANKQKELAESGLLNQIVNTAKSYATRFGIFTIALPESKQDKQDCKSQYHL